MHITYMPVQSPPAEAPADAAAFADSVRRTMASELGVTVTCHSYEDVWLASKAQAYNVNQTFEVSTLQSLFDLSSEGVTRLLERFHALDADGSGTLDLHEFTQALRLGDASPAYVARLFALADVDGDGSLSYSEFVRALALSSPSMPPEEKVTRAAHPTSSASSTVTVTALARPAASCGPRPRSVWGALGWCGLDSG